MHHVLSLLMRSMLWQDEEEPAWAAVMTKENRR